MLFSQILAAHFDAEGRGKIFYENGDTYYGSIAFQPSNGSSATHPIDYVVMRAGEVLPPSRTLQGRVIDVSLCLDREKCIWQKARVTSVILSRIRFLLTFCCHRGVPLILSALSNSAKATAFLFFGMGSDTRECGKTTKGTDTAPSSTMTGQYSRECGGTMVVEEMGGCAWPTVTLLWDLGKAIRYHKLSSAREA